MHRRRDRPIESKDLDLTRGLGEWGGREEQAVKFSD